MAMFLLLAPGCRKEHPGCTDPTSLNFDPEATSDDGSCTYGDPLFGIRVTHVVGQAPFQAGQVFEDSTGRKFQIDLARFYTSRPWIKTSTDSIPLFNYGHVIAGTQSQVTFGNAPVGSYLQLGWDLGVDSVTNHGDPLLFPEGHPLAATSPTNDHWTWNTGYVFLKIEGFADTSASRTGPVSKPWELHVATDPLLRHLSFSKTFDITTGTDHWIDVKVDWLKVLEGYDFRRNSHTTDVPSIATRTMDNLVSAISLQ